MSPILQYTAILHQLRFQGSPLQHKLRNVILADKTKYSRYPTISLHVLPKRTPWEPPQLWMNDFLSTRALQNVLAKRVGVSQCYQLFPKYMSLYPFLKRSRNWLNCLYVIIRLPGISILGGESSRYISVFKWMSSLDILYIYISIEIRLTFSSDRDYSIWRNRDQMKAPSRG